ncbi:MAG: type IV pilus assembly protein PilY1 [Rhodocyclaceae bacterium]|nr:MAG: type IV pilus assembly protein PilY1 [Rhodocyclaceae bacterium]TNC99241.1 MAG: type IV pilus assembly protein PilY1 [Rhodocyclaceae bacterium]
MKTLQFRRAVAWLLMLALSVGNITQAVALTLATTPLAATTTSVVRPNLMYVLDDSGSMGWDYTPDYINDATITDPTNPGITPPGSSGDRGTATVAGGVITAIAATGGNVYGHGTPTVLIESPTGTGAAATVTLAANKTIASVNVTSGGTGYVAATTYITFLGGLNSSAWGMCWGTTGTSNQGGIPKDTSVSPTCTTTTQPPYAAAAVNYQFYDQAVRYLPPLRADGTSYAASTSTAAKTDGFAGTGSTNLTTAWTHEVWCSTATPSPTPTAANIATHTQCKENLDTTADNLYPNVTYTFRKTYTGPASYYTMSPSEFCTSDTYTNCVRSTVPTVVSGTTFNVPSNYRWCSYYNPISHTFGGCQGRRDLGHYIPNYLGGWVSTGATGVQATAGLTINATTAGQSMGLSIGGVDVVGGATFTSALNGDQNTVAAAVCAAVQANTGGTGYSCSVTNNVVNLQAAIVGTAANGLQVLAFGPPAAAAANSTADFRVTTTLSGYQISSIRINNDPLKELISATVTAAGDCSGPTGCGNTARMICEAINSGPNQLTYIARSGEAAAAAADTLAYGTCQSQVDAYVQIKRIPADTTDNGFPVSVTGPGGSSTTLGPPGVAASSGAIQINSTGGATSITDVTLDTDGAGAGLPVSIFIGGTLNIADGTATTAIAAALAPKISGSGCSATASGNTVTITGCTCTDVSCPIVVTSPGAVSTGVMKVTSTTHTYGADLGGIQVGATSLAGHIASTSITNGTLVSANATTIRNAINAGTGTHGFTAAVPVLSGSDYNITITAPAGTAYNGQSFSFQNGTAVAAGSATSPTWNFSITNATADNAIIDYIRCDASDSASGDEIYPLSADASTGTVPVTSLTYTTALATALNANDINGYNYSCVRQGGTIDNYICDITGPTGVSACTSDLVLTDRDATITLDTYSKTSAGGTSCNAATWQFQITSVGDWNSIPNIYCGATKTVSSNTIQVNDSNSDSKRDQLRDDMQNNDINGYSYSCNSDHSANTLTCNVTGPTTPAACTQLDLSSRSAGITLASNGSVSQTCTTLNSATWRFTINTATAANKLINSIKCGAGGVNTITTGLVSTGPAPTNPAATTRINNLATALEGNAQNGYTISCTDATASTIQSDCTITGPVGTNACQGTDTGDSFNCGIGALSFKYDGNEDGSGIALAATGMTSPDTSGTWRSCVPASSNGSSGATAVDDFAPYLFSVSAFAGGSPSQGTTVTPIAVTAVGTIGTDAAGSTMSNGSAPSILTIPTNATGTAPNVLTMAGGSAADTAANQWNGVGIFKRVDIVNDGRTFNRASGRTDCTASTCNYTEEMQNFANWYSYYRTRMLMMKSATTLAFSQLDGNYRVGYDNICQATGTTVDNPVGEFTGAQRTTWWTSLTSASPNCATPLRAETAKIGRYYSGRLTTHPDPMEYSCQQNYMILVTDGYWNELESTSMRTADTAVVDIGNRDNAVATAPRPFYDGAEASTTCPAMGSGRGSTASSCRTLADIAWYYYSTDLRTVAFGNNSNGTRDVATNNVLTTADDKNQVQHMNFFAMGLGIDGTLGYRSDYQTASTGSYAEIIAGTRNWPAVANLDPTGVDDLWHATVNGHGKYFSARNVPNVVAGLREALNKIGARVGSAAAAATSNLEPVAGDNYAYVASYATIDWTGDLQSRSIDVATGDVSASTACTEVGSGCQWSAQGKLDQLTWSARRIFVAPTSAATGDPLRSFAFGNLSGAEQAYFSPSTLSQYAALSVSNPADITASNLVDFLRGNRGLEQDGDISHAQIWRYRAHVFGDIVNTQPVYMKAPSGIYTDAGYADFKAGGTAASRRPVVFVSAQDGMLHAINADTAAVTVSAATVQPGEEMWAFIPSQVLPSMKVLADVNYAHRYFVDGQITVADVDFGGGNWRTILVGGQGAGGTSYYALDVTDPLNPKYLWEFTNTNLGYTFSNATVTKLHNGQWAVMFASGYNNHLSGGNGDGYLFALNPETGAIETGYPIATGATTLPSNLGKLAVWADNPATDNTAQFAYAGDLNGDLWRFDLDHTSSGHTGVQVFKLAHLESGGVVQPITTKPELTQLESGTRLIFVGTGKYLETTDLTNTSAQGFYAIKDTMGAPNFVGGVSQVTWNPITDTTTIDVSGVATTVPMFLARKLISVKEDSTEITATANGVTRNVRMICAGASSTVTAAGACNNVDATPMDWTIYGGWYTSFPDTGERMNVDPKLVRGTLVFATNVPAADSCTVGGRSWANFLDYSTGLSVAGATTVSIKITDSLVVGITVVKLASGDYKAIATKSNYQQETLSVPVAPSPPGSGTSSIFGGKRGLWREYEAYQ